MDRIEIICAIVGAVAAILGGVWFIVRQAFKSGVNSQRLEDIEKDVSHLPCSTHSDDLMKIKSILVQRYPTSAGVFSIKASPRRLNELGKKLFDDIDGNAFLSENKKSLFDFIAQNNPLVKLDVEQAANAACQSLTATPAFNRLKDYVYNAPPVERADGEPYEITLNDICFVLSIPLRDMYLNQIGTNKQ